MEPKKKGVDLAIVFGGKSGKGGDKPSRPDDSEGDDMREEKDDDDDLPAGFEEAATEAFPDLDGDQDRLKAFLRAVKACTGEY